MKFSPVQKAFAALIVANVIWGAGSPIFKLALQSVPLFTLAFLRFCLGAFILLVILRSKIFFTVHQKKDVFLLVAYALFGITLNILFFFLGLQTTLAINAGIIVSSTPVLTLFFAMIFLRESFSLKKFFGALLGLFGIVLIIFQPLLHTGLDSSVAGNLFILLATLAWVAALVIGRDLFKQYSPLMLTFWAFVIAAASFLPLAIRDYLTSPLLYSSLSLPGIFGILWGAIFSSAAAYSLNAWGLSKVSATDTAMFTYIDPLAGAVLSVLLLSEPITGFFLLGSLLIFSGIGIAEGRLHYHPIRKLSATHKPPPRQSKKKQTIPPPNRSEVLQKIFKPS